MNNNPNSIEILLSFPCIESTKSKVDESNLKSQIKTPEENFIRRVKNTPNLIPQSFQDYVETLNEKTGLWRRIYMMLFLNLKKIFFFAKKPVNQDELSKCNEVSLINCEVFFYKEFQERNFLKKSNVLIIKNRSSNGKIILSFRNEKNTKYVLKILEEINETIKKEYLNIENNQHLSKQNFTNQNFTSNNFTIKQINNSKTFISTDNQKNKINKVKINSKSFAIDDNSKSLLDNASNKTGNYSTSKKSEKYYFTISNETDPTLLNARYTTEDKENINFENLEATDNFNFNNLSPLQNSQFKHFSKPKINNEDPLKKQNTKAHRKTNSMNLDISPSYKNKITNNVLFDVNEKNKICDYNDIFASNKKLNIFKTKNLNKSKNKINQATSNFKIVENYGNSNLNSSRYQININSKVNKTLQQDAFNQSFDINNQDEILNFINNNSKKNNNRNKNVEKTLNLKSNNTNYTTYSNQKKDFKIKFDYSASNEPTDKRIGENKSLINSFVDKTFTQEKCEIRKLMDKQFSGEGFNKYEENVSFVSKEENINKNNLENNKSFSQNSFDLKNINNSSSKSNLLHLKRNERKLNLLHSRKKQKMALREKSSDQIIKVNLNKFINSNISKNQKKTATNDKNQKKVLVKNNKIINSAESHITFNELVSSSKSKNKISGKKSLNDVISNSKYKLQENYHIEYLIQNKTEKSQLQNKTLFDKKNEISDVSRFTNEENTSLKNLISKLIINSQKKSKCHRKTESFYDLNENLEESITIDLNENNESYNLQNPKQEIEKKFFWEKKNRHLQNFLQINENLPHPLILESEKKIVNEKSEFDFIPNKYEFVGALEFEKLEKNVKLICDKINLNKRGNIENESLINPIVENENKNVKNINTKNEVHYNKNFEHVTRQNNIKLDETNFTKENKKEVSFKAADFSLNENNIEELMIFSERDSAFDENISTLAKSDKENKVFLKPNESSFDTRKKESNYFSDQDENKLHSQEISKLKYEKILTSGLLNDYSPQSNSIIDAINIKNNSVKTSNNPIVNSILSPKQIDNKHHINNNNSISNLNNLNIKTPPKSIGDQYLIKTIPITDNNLDFEKANESQNKRKNNIDEYSDLKLFSKDENESGINNPMHFYSIQNPKFINKEYFEERLNTLVHSIANSEEFIFDSFLLKSLLKNYNLSKRSLGEIFKKLREKNSSDLFSLQILTEMIGIISKKLLTKSILKSLEITNTEKKINPDFIVESNSNHSIEFCIIDIFNTFLGKNREKEDFYFKILPNLLKDEFSLEFSDYSCSIFDDISIQNLFVVMQYHNKIYFSENLDVNFFDKNPFIPQDIKFVSPFLIMKWNLKATMSLERTEKSKNFNSKFNKFNNSNINNSVKKINFNNNSTNINDDNDSINNKYRFENQMNCFNSLWKNKKENSSEPNSEISILKGNTFYSGLNNNNNITNNSYYNNNQNHYSSSKKEEEIITSKISFSDNKYYSNLNSHPYIEPKNTCIYRDDLIANANKKTNNDENLILNTNVKRIKNKNFKFENDNFNVFWLINDFKLIENSQKEFRLKLVKIIYFYLSEKQFEIALKLCDYYVQKYNETIFLNPVIYMILAEIYNAISGIDLARLFYEKALSILDWQFPKKNNPLLIDILYSFCLILLKNVDSEEMLLEIEDLLENCMKLCDKFYQVKVNDRVSKIKLQLTFLKILKLAEKYSIDFIQDNNNNQNSALVDNNNNNRLEKNLDEKIEIEIKELLDQFENCINFLIESKSIREACIYLNFFLDLIRDYPCIFKKEVVYKINQQLYETRKLL